MMLTVNAETPFKMRVKGRKMTCCIFLMPFALFCSLSFSVFEVFVFEWHFMGDFLHDIGLFHAITGEISVFQTGLHKGR